MSLTGAPSGAADGEAVVAAADPVPGARHASDRAEGLTNALAILAPSGADARIAARVLAKGGITTVECATMGELCDAIDRGIGAALIAEEALRSTDRERLVRALDEQPAWSDVPLIVLTGEGELGHAVARGVEEVARRGNATLFERPVALAP